MAISTDPNDPNFGLEIDQASPNFGLPEQKEEGGVGTALKHAGEAAVNVAKGFVTGLFPRPELTTLAEIVGGPGVIGPIEAYKAAQGVGQTVQAVQQSESTPPYSRERFEAGFNVLAQLGMAAGGVRGFTKPRLAEIAGLEKPLITPEAPPQIPETPITDIVTQKPEPFPSILQSAEDIRRTELAQQPEEVIPNATQERQVTEGNIPEYPGNGEGRPPAETGGGGGIEPSPEIGVETKAVEPSVPQPEQAAVPPSTTTTAPGTQAVIAEARETRGIDPYERQLRQTWGEAVDRANARIAQEPKYPENLAREIANKPRAANPDEHVALLKNWREKESVYDRAIKAGDQDALEIARQGAEEAYDALDKSGTAGGRLLAARQMVLDEFYTPKRMKAEMEAAGSGKKLTKAEEAQVDKVHDEFQKAKTGASEKQIQLEADRGMSEKLADRIKRHNADLDRAAAEARESIMKERGSLKWEENFNPCVL